MELWPQYTWLALMALSMSKAINHYGELKKPDRYDIVDVLVGPVLAFWILAKGGFFVHMGIG